MTSLIVWGGDRIRKMFLKEKKQRSGLKVVLVLATASALLAGLLFMKTARQDNPKIIEKEKISKMEIQSFSKGHFLVENESKFGYVDMKGKLVIKPEWDYISSFDKFDYAKTIKTLITKNDEKEVKINRVGLVDISGKTIFENKYDDVVVIDKDLFVVVENEKKNLVNSVEKKLLEEDAYEIVKIDNSRFIIIFSEKTDLDEICFGFVDEKRESIEKRFLLKDYDNLIAVDEEVLIVEKNKKVKMIDYDGKEIIPFEKYSYISKFKNGYAVIEKDKKFGVIDKSGKEVIKPKYLGISVSNLQDRFIFKEGELYGFINLEEKIIVPAIHEDITDFYGKRAIYSLDKFLKIIDENGKNVGDEKLEIVIDMKNNVVIGGTEAGMVAVKEDGARLVKKEVDDMNFWGSKYIKVKDRDKVEIFDYMGKSYLKLDNKDIDREFYNQINTEDKIYLFDE